MAKPFYTNKFAIAGILIIVGIVGFGVWFDSLQKYEKIIFLTQLGGVATDEIVYPSGKSSADYEGYQIINCLRGYCVDGLTYIPAQVQCSGTTVTVSEFDYPEACPPPATKTCPDGSTIAYTSTCPIPDSDGDGLKDNVDSCPNDPNNTPNGCPIPLNEIDTDGDGIFDDVDLCIAQAENINGLNDFDGCPDVIPLSAIDDDNDLIFADVDVCPLEPETYNNYQDGDGCPDEVPVIDSDGDGIQDEIDLCPNTGFNVEVDNDGCVLPVITANDTDGDGYVNFIANPTNLEAGTLDYCPNQFDEGEDVAGADKVENFFSGDFTWRGCPENVIPPDDDNDGVFNLKDKCSNTSSGATIDEDGCPVSVSGDCPDPNNPQVFTVSNFETSPVPIQGDFTQCPEFDLDSDGISNNENPVGGYDDCPDTVGTAITINTTLRGCSVEQIAEKEGILDNDNDGVNNNDDFCPNTPSGATVDTQGCEIILVDPTTLDSDNDGVPNASDLCQTTSANTDVDSTGCEIPVANTIFDDLFGNNDDVVCPQGLEPINGICPDVPVVQTTNDNDGDGVLDALDNCPTRRGTIEFDGCPDPSTLDTSSPFDTITDLFTPPVTSPVTTPTTPSNNQPVIPTETSTDRSGLQEPSLVDGLSDSTLIFIIMGIIAIVIVMIIVASGKAKL